MAVQYKNIHLFISPDEPGRSQNKQNGYNGFIIERWLDANTRILKQFKPDRTMNDILFKIIALHNIDF